MSAWRAAVEANVALPRPTLELSFLPGAQVTAATSTPSAEVGEPITLEVRAQAPATARFTFGPLLFPATTPATVLRDLPPTVTGRPTTAAGGAEMSVTVKKYVVAFHGLGDWQVPAVDVYVHTGDRVRRIATPLQQIHFRSALPFSGVETAPAELDPYRYVAVARPRTFVTAGTAWELPVLFGMLAAAALVVVVVGWRHRRLLRELRARGPVTGVPGPDSVAADPCAGALTELDRLRDGGMVAAGDITGIARAGYAALRRLLEDLYAIRAETLSTAAALEALPAASASIHRRLCATLTELDRLKFAPHRPSAPDAAVLWRELRQLVEQVAEVTRVQRHRAV